MCALWIVSYHGSAITEFEASQYEIIEKVAKVLDYFNKEKLVRIILHLFLNLKDHEGCLEQMSDINAISIVTKL